MSLDRDVDPVLTERQLPPALIQFAQFPPTQLVTPPTLPLHRPLGTLATTNSLKRIDATLITTGGAPLPVAIRNPLARTFSIDLTPIRVHTGIQAQKIVRSFSTRAFAYGNNIFLGSGEQPTDLRLMAHEVAHVVQQSHGVTLQHFTVGSGDTCEREAEQASAAALRGESFTVQQHTSPRPQGLFGIELPNPLNWLANRANNIPGFRMFTIILGVNPINMSPVARSAANIMRALVEFMPGGGLITQALDNYGIFDRVGGWVEQQIASLGMTGGAIAAAVREFISSLSLSDLANLGGVWDRAQRIFSQPIDRIISFASGLVTGIIQFIKDAILQPLAQLASQTRGWDLLTAVLGRNPITGDAVPRNAETLIGGFMRLIGQEEIWTNLQRANAVGRAWSWFQGALSGLLGFVSQIPTLFLSALRSLELMDIVLLPRAFAKVGSVFGSFLGQFFSWAGQQVMSLLEIIFEVLAPTAMPYIRRAAGALRTIIQNPIGFIGNLVRAGIQGFRQFAGNFLTHLRTSLINWLTGTMSGAAIYIPQAFNLREIIKFVLSVLGLTWQNIRTKLVRVIGESAVRALEAGFEIVMTLVTQGPAAAWEQIREGISNLQEMVMGQVMTFVRDRVVQAAITRLVTSLNPAGAFIQAVIAIYNTVMFFVERLRQIAQVAMSFIDSMAAIASGNIGAAASRVEQTMAGLLTLVISFLARIAGLGRVSDAVINIINRVRAPIDRALDRVVAWIVAQARRLGNMFRGQDARSPQEKQRDLNRAVQELRPRVAQLVRRGVPRQLLTLRLAVWRRQYNLTSLSVEGGRVVAAINPTAEMYSAQERQIGAALEPILQRAEAAFLRAVRQRPASAARITAAQQTLRAGGRMPAGMTPIERTVVIRSVLRGRVAVPQTPVQGSGATRATIMERGPGTPYELQMRWPGGGDTPRALVNDPAFPPFPRRGRLTYHYQFPSQRAGRPDPSAHLPGQSAPGYGGVNIWAAQNVGQPMHPAIEGLSREVEPARAEGMIAAHTVAGAVEGLPLAAQNDPRQQGGAPVVAGPAERVHGLTAGMATPESAAAAETRRTTGAAPTDPSEARAEQVRHGSYAVIFQTLRQALNSGGSVLGEPGAPLRELATAFDAWLQAALPRNFDANDEEVMRLARDLQNRLAAFLRQQIPS